MKRSLTVFAMALSIALVACGGGGGSSNTAPMANEDAYIVTEGDILNVSSPGVLGNDTDADSDPLTCQLDTDVTNGTLSLSADGSFTYTPDPGYSGMDSFTYRANDGTDDSNVATVTIRVNAIPVVTNDAYIVTEGDILNVSSPGVLGNDTDADSDHLTCQLDTDVTNGTLSLSSDGSFIYTSSPGYIGTDSFTYKANDGTDDSNVATVAIKVNAVPIAADDTYTAPQGYSQNIPSSGVLGNDTDANSDSLTSILVTDVTHGTLSLSADGSFTYTSNPAYMGTDSFTYKANDGFDDSAVATVTITITIAPYYSNAVNWNDYVKNDGNTIFDASNTASTGTESGDYWANIHGGEMRAWMVTGLSNCTGITAVDNLSAFDWTCYDGTDPVTVVSTGLKDGAGLSDLIDFDLVEWRDNGVTVNLNSLFYAASPVSAWWNNPVVVDNDGGLLTSMGTVFIVTSPPGSGTNYEMGADKVGLVIRPGQTLEGVGQSGGYVVRALNQSFLWFEGNVKANTAIPEDYGIRLSQVGFTRLNNVTVSQIDWMGVSLSHSDSNILSNLTLENSNIGSHFYSSSYNILRYGTATGNENTAVALQTSSNNLLDNLSLSNNDYGVYFYSSSKNTLSNVTAAGGTYGIFILGTVNEGPSYDNILSNVTTGDNTDEGFFSSNFLNNILSNVTAMNNWRGVILAGSDNNTLSNLVSAENDVYGVFLSSSSNNTFTGLLKVGNNTIKDCIVIDGTDPGLDDGTCLNNGTSDAFLSTDVSLTGSFFGKVTADDTVNISDNNGYALFDSITDWTSFENTYRHWGKDDSAFSTTLQGTASSGDTCRIWDWSLSTGDIGDSGSPVLLNVLDAPSPANSLTHTWSDSSTTTFLANAVEIMGDRVGNDNALCEGGEDCLDTPNIGSYQGHGELILTDTFTFQSQNVNIYAYTINGY